MQNLSSGVALTALIALTSPHWIGVAFAQSDATETKTDEVQSIEPEEEEEARQEKIVVTGSLIPRDEFSSIAPLEIITPDLAFRRGDLTLADMVQGSTLALGAPQRRGNSPKRVPKSRFST